MLIMLIITLIMVVCAVIAIFLKPSGTAFRIMTGTVATLGAVSLVIDMANGLAFSVFLDTLIVIFWGNNFLFYKSGEPIIKASISVKKERRQ